MDPQTLQKRLDRAHSEIAQLEGMIEDKTRSLYVAQGELERTVDFLGEVLACIRSAVLVLDAGGRVRSANPAACALLGREEGEVVGLSASALMRFPDGLEDPDVPGVTEGQHEVHFVHAEGHEVPVLYSGNRLGNGVQDDGVVCVALDLSEKKQLELELRHAQKLESLGQMAAGIAHEINTPIQFVGDSIGFLQDSFEDLQAVLDAHMALREASDPGEEHRELSSKLTEAEEHADLEFLAEEVPAAFERAAEGVDRVGRIVRAMKEFSHPGDAEREPLDLNEAVRTTLTVAKNEYKYIADVVTELGELPPVLCHAGDINQVILNLVVNAAHAIEGRNDGERGTIRVRTSCEGGFAVIEVTDDGCGIPHDVRNRIFDPFFTTKAVGRGTGQGLSITHKIIVEKHAGRLTFDTEVGVGTTFRIGIPCAGEEANRDAA
ncbi:MAG: ATP-binding protein [Planctomycetota bacterium]